MHAQTGAIATFETDLDARAAGYTVKLNKSQFAQFSGMNRHDRLAQVAQSRKRKRLKK